MGGKISYLMKVVVWHIELNLTGQLKGFDLVTGIAWLAVIHSLTLILLHG
jgi:hypothetical protein